MSPQSGFLLSKWYLDCVQDDGTAFVAYAAALRWKAFSLHYTSNLIVRPASRPVSRTSVLETSFPRLDGSTISWNSSSLNFAAEWNGIVDPAERTLFANDEGKIVWSCLLPSAKVQILTGAGGRITGNGYGELITISIAPWRLPISELRWGRFLSDTDALVWIDWTGRAPKSLLLHNRSEVALEDISDSRIRGSGGIEVDLDRGTIIRDGPILSTALADIPGIGKVFPDRILQMHETKWLSRGNAKIGQSRKTHGWAIHERVKFQ